jgi:hypothetical protein
MCLCGKKPIIAQKPASLNVAQNAKKVVPLNAAQRSAKQRLSQQKIAQQKKTQNKHPVKNTIAKKIK